MGLCAFGAIDFKVEINRNFKILTTKVVDNVLQDIMTHAYKILLSKLLMLSDMRLCYLDISV